jgi:hypothetical protein
MGGAGGVPLSRGGVLGAGPESTYYEGCHDLPRRPAEVPGRGLCRGAAAVALRTAATRHGQGGVRAHGMTVWYGAVNDLPVGWGRRGRPLGGEQYTVLLNIEYPSTGPYMGQLRHMSCETCKGGQPLMKTPSRFPIAIIAIIAVSGYPQHYTTCNPCFMCFM